MTSRLTRLFCPVAFLFMCFVVPELPAAEGDAKLYARFQHDGKVSYGQVEEDQIKIIDGNLFGKWKLTDQSVPLADVKLLVPSRARQVFAMAGNYRSHLSGNEIPEKFKTPQPFLKTVSSLQRHEGTIQLPPDSAPVHYEAEMVVVIGKKCRNVSKDEALNYVLGVTCGNDVSARAWQKNDVQWWRAKASDTFSPCGPFIATGLNYDDLLMKLILNGKVVQEERTSMLIHDVAATVSFISQHTTLLPGDLIFTGTPGKTAEIKPGDIVEVELEGVGVLRNKVVKEKQ